MPRFEDRLRAAVASVGPKPADTAPQAQKKNWSQTLSDRLALAIGQELRDRGMKGAMPVTPTQLNPSGTERRLAGGIGAKKVDVTWATEESGLIFAISVKTIMFRDGSSGNFQKNLTNRRGDLLIESVTLHRRFPYAVLSAFLFLDAEAANDGTARRQSTFQNAFPRLRLFTRRPDPSGREEQYERFYLIMLDTTTTPPTINAYEVSDSTQPVSLSAALDDMITLIGERNFDLYDGTNGIVRKI